MKKAIAIILLLSMLGLLMGNFSLVTVAKDDREDLGVINVCEYNDYDAYLCVGGTIFHDVMISHKDYKLSLYEIPFGTTYWLSNKSIVLSSTPTYKIESVIVISLMVFPPTLLEHHTTFPIK